MSKSKEISSNNDIAIIGMSCRVSGANTTEEFWDIISKGEEKITFMTEDDLKANGIEKERYSQPDYIPARGMLSGIDLFDNEFFRISPKEAELLDPQHRLFLETAWEALENSGYESSKYDGRIGVYSSSAWNSYLLFNLATDEHLLKSEAGHMALLGNDKDHLATRVSYKMNLTGPSITIQTACSSSLVAISTACQSLQLYQSDIALAGGVSITIPQEGYIYRRGGTFSKDGHCRPFDNNASGTVIGDGVGVVVLKRLEDALQDGDTIHAVIKGFAVNNDGSRKMGYTAPSINGQIDAILEALMLANTPVDTISYVESHGTGTVLGDPVEISALSQAFRTQSSRSGFCGIGSVKANIGHLDAAAGVAGLIKVVLALKNKKIPPLVNFQSANTNFDFDSSPFYINTELINWDKVEHPRRAAVSSFGLGGTNSHFILEEAPITVYQDSAYEKSLNSEHSTQETEPELIILSARTPEKLKTIAKNYVSFLCNNKTLDLSDICYTLQLGRKSFEYRIAVVCNSIDEAIIKLKEHSETDNTPSSNISPLVFAVFPGHISEFKSIVQLYENQPVFKNYIAECLIYIDKDTGDIIKSFLLDKQRDYPENKFDYKPFEEYILFMLEYALARLWMHWKISFNAMIGFGTGEIVAGVLAEVLTLKDAITLLKLRSTFLNKTVLDNEENKETMYLKLLEQSNSPIIPFVLGNTGEWYNRHNHHTPEYWKTIVTTKNQSLTDPTNLIAQENTIFLGIGSEDGHILSLKERLHQHTFLITNQKQKPQHFLTLHALLEQVGQLWQLGISIDWVAFREATQKQRIPLPTYPFNRQRHWFVPNKKNSNRLVAEQTVNLCQSFTSSANELVVNEVLPCETLSKLSETNKYLDQLCASYIINSLQQLHIFKDDTLYTVKDVIDQSKIIPYYHQLIVDFLELLGELGFLKKKGVDSYQYTGSLNEIESTEILLYKARNELKDSPHIPEFIKTCGEALKDVLMGNRRPIELFTSVLDDKAKKSIGNTIPEQFIRQILIKGTEHLLLTLQKKQVINVLEVGGGTGIATKAILPLLSKVKYSYDFTDINPYFLKAAQSNFKSFSSLLFKELDIEKHPAEQGFKQGSYDMLVAVNVLHILQDIDQSLEYIKWLLAPSGILIVWELTENTLDFAMTYGLVMNPISGQNKRTQGRPFLSKSSWYQSLEKTQFTNINILPKNLALGQHIIVAQAGNMENHLPKIRPSVETTQSWPKALHKKEDVNNWFFAPTWKRVIDQKLRLEVEAFKEKDVWVLFHDFHGMDDQLEKAIQHKGGVKPIRVYPDISYSKQSANAFTINFNNKSDYITLFKAIEDEGGKINRIAYFLTPENESTSATKYDAKSLLIENRISGLLYLIQALGENIDTHQVTVAAVVQSAHDIIGNENIIPALSMTSSLCSVTNIEFPQLNCFCADVPQLLDGIPSSESVINNLVTDISFGTKKSILAYRGMYRWERVFQQLEVPDLADKQFVFKEEGVYIIFGGLGHVGMTIAKYLAKSYHAKLILVSRRSIIARKEWKRYINTHPQDDSYTSILKHLVELEQYASELVISSSDITNLEQVQELVNNVGSQYGQINGVIHSAGTLGDGSITLKSLDEIADIISAKVTGTQVLDYVFRDHQLDFLALFTSLSSVLPGFGQAAYSIANSYMDAYAENEARKGRKHIMSLSWDVWQGEGMAYDAKIPKVMASLKADDFKQRGILPEEGQDVFCKAIASDFLRIMICTSDYLRQSEQEGNIVSQMYMEAMEQVSNTSENNVPKQPDANESIDENDVKHFLTDIWKELLGIEEIDPNDDFIDLGGDSLIGMQLISKIQAVYGLELSVGIVYEDCTIALLSEKIINHLEFQIKADD